ncbi:hypothetical protein [Flavobacterium sp. HBTb2-11-1]|uniref:hypothetical protein n=1 Tax=Flavobacterium sp. HBTb2-11-1 TaxID=2692212 RepID=UPI00136B280B|nr:hypothetical protein [Flavobacterium sp. HBTb2-11-1]MXO04370.1 hypothetical protein [Flavobacterium sp. HBTb2-11-1]
MNDLHRYCIGYVDEEPQFVDKFRRQLKSAFDIVTFELNSELTIENLILQIEEAELDCLIVDFELTEAAIVQFNGDEIIDALLAKYPYFPVFIITSKEEDDVLDHVIDGDILRLKEELDTKPNILIQRITNKIENYISSINEAQKVILDLVEKRNQSENGLSVEDEVLMLDNYAFLDKIYPQAKVLPESLLKQSSLTKFDEFAAETKEILDALNNLSKNE